MIKIVGLVFLMFLLSSCGAGGGAVAVPGLRLQGHWPEVGWDRYESVIYPAGPDGLKH